MNKKVSVIVPVYNVDKSLCKCIDSILVQEYENFELILIDDGSTDKSGIICDEYAQKDSRIKVLHTENRGVSAARNAGIKVSSGKYITFIDSDDWVESKYISTLVQLINNSDIAICGYTMVFKKRRKSVCVSDEEFRMCEVDKFLRLFNVGLIAASACVKLLKAEIIKDNNILFEETVKLAEDTRFMLKYYKYVDKVAITEKSLYDYDKTVQSSATKKYYSDSNVILYELQKRIREILPQKLNEAAQKQLDIYTASSFINVINHYHYSEKNFDEKIKKIAESIKLYKNILNYNEITEYYTEEAVKYLKEENAELFYKTWLKKSHIKRAILFVKRKLSKYI